MMETEEQADNYDPDELYEEDYHYQDWGVDRVDLDFKSGRVTEYKMPAIFSNFNFSIWSSIFAHWETQRTALLLSLQTLR